MSENKSKINKKPIVIGICGGSASGKTSVAAAIIKEIGQEEAFIFSLDNYYIGLTPEEKKDISNYNFDSPDALNLDEAAQQIEDLLENKAIKQPIYSFISHQRENGFNVVNPKKVIIIEGIFAFYNEKIREKMDVLVYIDTSPDIMFLRRIERDQKERGFKLEESLRRYMQFVKPALDNIISPCKKYANFVIPKGAENTIAIDILCKHVVKLFRQNNSEKNIDGDK